MSDKRPDVFVVPEREHRPLPPPQEVDLSEEIERRYATRRRLLKWVIRAGYGAFALAFTIPALALRSLSTPKSEIASGDHLVFAAPTDYGDTGQPVQAAGLPVGAGVHAFPSGKTDNQNNLVELVRIAEGQGADGLVAYSAICTHLGCAVYAQLDQNGNIACPCHNSQYDPRQGAKVVNPPAPRPLPSLPITVDDQGIVVVNGGFSGPIGPE